MKKPYLTVDNSISSKMFFISQEPAQQLIPQRHFTTKLTQVCVDEIMTDVSFFVWLIKKDKGVKILIILSLVSRIKTEEGK